MQLRLIWSNQASLNSIIKTNGHNNNVRQGEMITRTGRQPSNEQGLSQWENKLHM